MQFRAVPTTDWPAEWRTSAAAQDAVGKRCDACAKAFGIEDDVIEDDDVWYHESCYEIDPEATTDYLEMTVAWKRGLDA